MIITKLQGGLGNQMFQYAAGRALAERLGTDLVCDARFFGTHTGQGFTPRKLELNDLNVRVRVATDPELASVKPAGFLRRWLNISGWTILGDRHPGRFRKTKGNVYLDGYWQSELFFGEIRPLLLREFTPAAGWPGFPTVVKRLASDTSVAVHVRRGDYVHLPSARDYHGVLEMEYYTEAMRYMRKRIPGARFFVFSDEPAWCISAFGNLGVEEIIEDKGHPPARDLLLMSACGHNIIANSSFSWWGAWLNNNPDKIVVMPRKWFRVNDDRALYIAPKGWIRL